MLLNVKVGDYVRGCEGFAQEDSTWIKKGGVYKILELNAEKEEVRLEGCSDFFWCLGLLEKAFCPKCKKDPCACDDDVELDKAQFNCKCHVVLDKHQIKESIAATRCFHCGERTKYAQNQLKPEDTVTKPAVPVYEKKPLPAGALTSWPGLHEKMAVAKLLDELKDD